VVLQAAREVARIVTLINKMIGPKDKPKAKFIAPAAAAGPESPVKGDPKGGDSQSEAHPAFKDKRIIPPPTRSGPSTAAPPGKTGIRPEDLILPDLETFIPSHEVAAWDGVTQDLFADISRSYQELQAIGAEMAATLEAPAGGNGSQA
jgi:hypothetical protein